jgi:plastocyanin domain-containing protein
MRMAAWRGERSVGSQKGTKPMKRFFVRTTAPRAPHASSLPASNELYIRVDGGYEPDTVVAQLGRPVRITFHREDESSCSEQVVFADFGVDAFLPRHEDVTVELSPEHAGEYDFTCGMGMLRGRLTVVAGTQEPLSADANERNQP